jgi:hypothetical protein
MPGAGAPVVGSANTMLTERTTQMLMGEHCMFSTSLQQEPSSAPAIIGSNVWPVDKLEIRQRTLTAPPFPWQPPSTIAASANVQNRHEVIAFLDGSTFDLSRSAWYPSLRWSPSF